MLLPICPICHIQYSLSIKPIVLQPCGHGVCLECHLQCEQRSIDDCSICRQPVISFTPNYDLIQICKKRTTDWKFRLENAVASTLSGVDFTINDSLEVVSPLIILKANNVHSLREFRKVISDLVICMSPVDLYKWIEVLKFDQETVILGIAHQMVSDQRFLQVQNALWVLELVHQ